MGQDGWEVGVSGRAAGSNCHGRKLRRSLDKNRAVTVVISAHGRLDRLCWRFFFNRGSVGVEHRLLARAHSGQNGNPMRTAVLIDCVGGVGLGLLLGLAWVGCWLGCEVRNVAFRTSQIKLDQVGVEGLNVPCESTL